MKTIFTFIFTFILSIQLIFPNNLYSLALSSQVRGVAQEPDRNKEETTLFPKEVLLKILLILPTIRDIASMAKTSHLCSILANDHTIWNQLLKYLSKNILPPLLTELHNMPPETKARIQTKIQTIAQNPHAIPLLIKDQDPKVVLNTLLLLRTIAQHEQGLQALLPHLDKIIPLLLQQNYTAVLNTRLLLETIAKHEQGLHALFLHLDKIIPLLAHQNDDVRATTLFLLQTIAKQQFAININIQILENDTLVLPKKTTYQFTLYLSLTGIQHPQIGAWEFLEGLCLAQHHEWTLFDDLGMADSENLAKFFNMILPLIDNKEALLQQLGEVDTNFCSVFGTTQNLLNHLQQAIEQSA